MDKKEFDLKKKLLDLEHKYKVEEINLKFQKELEIQRIKSAEIKRSIERKEDMRFMRGYNNQLDNQESYEKGKDAIKRLRSRN